MKNEEHMSTWGNAFYAQSVGLIATAVATVRRSYGADMAGDDPADAFDSSDLLCKNSRDLL